MKKALDNAKQLRQNQTDTEAILWARLRNRSLNGIKFRRQVPIDKYIADFVYIDKETGKTVVCDTKSEATKTPAYKIKKKLMLYIHHIKITEV